MDTDRELNEARRGGACMTGYLGVDAEQRLVFELTVTQIHVSAVRVEAVRQLDNATEVARQKWTDEQWLLAQGLSTADRGGVWGMTYLHGVKALPWPTWEGTFEELCAVVEA